jgi:hypothetical protein
MKQHISLCNRDLICSIGALSLALGLVACEDARDANEGLGFPYLPGGSGDGDDTGEDSASDGDAGGNDGGDSGDAGTDGASGDGQDGGNSGDDDGTPTGGGGDTDAGDTDDAGYDDPYDADRDRCVEIINGYRETIGRAPLTRWTGQAAEECVDGQAKTDSLEYGGVHAEFGKCGEALQNEGGWAGPMYPGFEQNLQGMWNEGPGGGHYENMASAGITQVLCGFYQSTSGQYAGWWSAVQDFR